MELRIAIATRVKWTYQQAPPAVPNVLDGLTLRIRSTRSPMELDLEKASQ